MKGRGQIMVAVKAVQQRYKPGPEILGMLEQFRKMMNDCLRIGLESNATSMKSLSMKSYHELDRYDLPAQYRLTAISKAAGILRNYRRTVRKNSNTKHPYAKKLTLTDCYTFKIENTKLRLTLSPHKYVYIPLTQHTLQVLSCYTSRSVTLTTRTVSITFSKETAQLEPAAYVGIDSNVDNISVASVDGSVDQFDLSHITEIKAVYRQVKSHMTRNDYRVRTSVFQKYGLKQRNRIQHVLHQASKQIVRQALLNHHGVVLENLTGIRRLYRKHCGQGSDYRGRMNSWSFAELQRQIEYKARWEGIPIIYVNPAGTSAKCSICGSRMTRIPEENRKLKCHSCGFTVDRDVNAARNILAAGMRAVRFAAVASAGEAMVAVKRRPVDADELTHRMGS